MHLIIRAKEEEEVAAMKMALTGSMHVVILEPIECDIRVSTDAEFLTMGMAEALGLSPSLEPFRVVIVDAPSQADWIPAPLVITGVTLDRQYNKRQELEILLRQLWHEAARFNASANNQICSIGIQMDYLNMFALPLPVVAEGILESIGPGS